MTDLEITRLCAEAMGICGGYEGGDSYGVIKCKKGQRSSGTTYHPLHDDAQAMALVKKFGISIQLAPKNLWHAWIPLLPADGENPDLNRAICLCVAKMQAKK